MNATSVMDPNPTYLKSTDIIRTAVRFIMENRYRNLPVVDEDGRYLGVFGVNCLLRQVLPKAVLMEKGLTNLSFIHESLGDLQNRYEEMSDQPISVCMNTEIETVNPDTPLVETLYVLHKNRTSIPVVEPDTGQLAGMISYWDVGEKILTY